jgi:hypothetical protein
MARIKSEAVPEKGILRKLFYPLHVKLPIEAVVAILMAVTTIYVFRTIQPEMKIERAPSEEIAPQVPSAPLSPQLISPREEKQEGKGGFEAEKPVPAGKPEILDRSSELSKAPKVFAKQDKNIPSAGATARSEIKRETLPAGPQEKALSDSRNVAMNIMVNVKNVETARKEIENAVVQLGGKVTGTESVGDEAILTAELDSKKLKRLIEKIKLLGKVEEKEGDLAGTEGDMEIRIEIVNTHR